jgi:hypothetical protein
LGDFGVMDFGKIREQLLFYQICYRAKIRRSQGQ